MTQPFGVRRALCFVAGCAMVVFSTDVKAQDIKRNWIPQEMTLGISLNSPKDVNEKPLCEQLAYPCTATRTIPDLGLQASYAHQLVPHLYGAVQASFDGNYWFKPDSSGLGIGTRNFVGALLVGVRAMSRSYDLFSKRGSGARPHVQVLVGPEASLETPTRIAIEAGAGADFELFDALRVVRLDVNYRKTNGSGRNLSSIRFEFGIAFGIGTKFAPQGKS